ncbi:MAG TPA: pyridoxamine 5'-phosphate oxidase family protein [Burkholderiaceae bacterium]|jgi:general stress protein 26|nr:pyridoxamine 5'-phosphate oxidase family protein [Burkholderiaceae bacterium]
MTTDTQAGDHRAQLYDMIKGIKFAMFTTHKPQGHLHSRPMTLQNKAIDEEDALWFFMSRSGSPVAEFRGDDQVNVSFADPGKDTYVSVSGVARVVEDAAKKRALWSKLNEAWFHGGVDDPGLALVRVDIEHADYWDVKENKLVQLWKMAEAAVTGRTPQLGEHGTLRAR